MTSRRAPLRCFTRTEPSNARGQPRRWGLASFPLDVLRPAFLRWTGRGASFRVHRILCLRGCLFTCFALFFVFLSIGWFIALWPKPRFGRFQGSIGVCASVKMSGTVQRSPRRGPAIAAKGSVCDTEMSSCRHSRHLRTDTNIRSFLG